MRCASFSAASSTGSRGPGWRSAILGETLPFLLWRFDSRAGPGFYAVKLASLPSQYVKDNVVVATSGMCSAEPLACTISALGHDRVMFAADYPFESMHEAAHFIDDVAIEESVRNDICFNNAARLLGLQGLVSRFRSSQETCGTLGCELRNRGDTSNSMFLVPP